MSRLFLGLSGWDWLEIISLSIVFLGAVSALFLRLKKSKVSPDKNGLIPVGMFLNKEQIEKRRARWEYFWEGVLVFGLICEIPATKHSISESARLNNENLVLQTNVLALQQQVMETSNNIVKNDVRNWPISEVNATAWFTVMGTNMDDELTNLPSGRKAQMILLKNEREGFPLDNLEAGNGDISGHVWTLTIGQTDRRIYRVELHSFNFLTAQGIKPPPVKTIDDVHLVHVDLNFLPRDSQIANGRVILTVNNVTKYFDVPNQNDTNSYMGWQNDFQCWFVATNGVQSSPKQFLYLRN